jgi:vacuolar protein-sorting-associated protein 4
MEQQPQVKGKDSDGNPIEQWTPCSPGDPAAVEKSWTDIGEKELQEPPLIVSCACGFYAYLPV